MATKAKSRIMRGPSGDGSLVAIVIIALLTQALIALPVLVILATAA